MTIPVDKLSDEQIAADRVLATRLHEGRVVRLIDALLATRGERDEMRRRLTKLEAEHAMAVRMIEFRDYGMVKTREWKDLVAAVDAGDA